MELSKREFIRGSVGIMSSVALPVKIVKGQTNSGFVEITIAAEVPQDTLLHIEIFEDKDQNYTGENSEFIQAQNGTNTYVCQGLDGVISTDKNYWINLQMSTTNTSLTPKLDYIIFKFPEETISDGDSDTTTTTEDTSISLLDRSFSTGKSILLAGVYILLGYMTIKSRSGLGFLGWAFSLIALILSIVLGLDMLYVWGSIALAIIMFLISLSLTPWGVKA